MIAIRAFSLIELMVTIAIVAVLAAIAAPAYKEYQIRSRVAMGISAAEPLKDIIELYYAENGVFPANASALGLTSTSFADDNVQAIYPTIWWYGANDGSNFANGCSNIEIQYANLLPQAAHSRLTLHFRAVNGIITWSCATILPPESTYIPEEYLPGDCKVPVNDSCSST